MPGLLQNKKPHTIPARSVFMKEGRMVDIDDFRAETRSWLEENCPVGARGPGPISTGATSIAIDHEDTELWLDRMIEKGWTAPVWP